MKAAGRDRRGAGDKKTSPTTPTYDPGGNKSYGLLVTCMELRPDISYHRYRDCMGMIAGYRFRMLKSQHYMAF